jgi:hypothetical protein
VVVDNINTLPEEHNIDVSPSGGWTYPDTDQELGFFLPLDALPERATVPTDTEKLVEFRRCGTGSAADDCQYYYLYDTQSADIDAITGLRGWTKTKEIGYIPKESNTRPKKKQNMFRNSAGFILTSPRNTYTGYTQKSSFYLFTTADSITIPVAHNDTQFLTGSADITSQLRSSVSGCTPGNAPANKCEFYCPTGRTWCPETKRCIASGTPCGNICQGLKPSNGILCTGDDSGLA